MEKKVGRDVKPVERCGRVHLAVHCRKRRRRPTEKGGDDGGGGDEEGTVIGLNTPSLCHCPVG